MVNVIKILIRGMTKKNNDSKVFYCKCVNTFYKDGREKS